MFGQQRSRVQKLKHSLNRKIIHEDTHIAVLLISALGMQMDTSIYNHRKLLHH